MKILIEHWRLFAGIYYYLIFAYDIENDRDFFTWIWLLSSIILFIFYIIKQLKTK